MDEERCILTTKNDIYENLNNLYTAYYQYKKRTNP